MMVRFIREIAGDFYKMNTNGIEVEELEFDEEITMRGGAVPPDNYGVQVEIVSATELGDTAAEIEELRKHAIKKDVFIITAKQEAA